MDKKLKAETFAFLLFLAAFPIISWGTMAGNRLIWWLGFICLIAGGLLPVWTRYMDHSGDRIRDVGIEFDDRPS